MLWFVHVLSLVPFSSITIKAPFITMTSYLNSTLYPPYGHCFIYFVKPVLFQQIENSPVFFQHIKNSEPSLRTQISWSVQRSDQVQLYNMTCPQFGLAHPRTWKHRQAPKTVCSWLLRSQEPSFTFLLVSSLQWGIGQAGATTGAPGPQKM